MRNEMFPFTGSILTTAKIDGTICYNNFRTNHNHCNTTEWKHIRLEICPKCAPITN